jgi:N6-L-threonylcarbamoyladenine synthase
MKATEEFGVRSILVGGGVSANTYIREQLKQAIDRGPASTKLLIPPAELATDNALMIALAGYFHALNKDFADPQSLKANGNLKITA